MNVNDLTSVVSSGVTALALVSIGLALSIIIARRETQEYRGPLIVLALFFLSAGATQALSLVDAGRTEVWWAVSTAILSVAAAALVIVNLPQYVRMRKMAEELRGQAGFLE